MKRIGITGRAGAGKDALAAHLLGLHGGYKVSIADAIKRMCREVFNCPGDSLFGDSARRNEPVPMRSFESWRATAMYRFHTVYEAMNTHSPWDGFELMHYVVEKHFAARAAEPWTITTRYVLQIVGTEWGRELDEDMWVRELARVCDVIEHRLGAMYSPAHGVAQRGGGPLALDRITGDSVIVTSDVRYANEADEIRAAGGLVYYVDAERRLGPRTDAHRSEPSAEAMQAMADLVIDNNGAMDFSASVRNAVAGRR